MVQDFSYTGIAKLASGSEDKLEENAMAVDEAYQKAEQRIEQARRDGATTLDLGYLGLTEVPEAIGKLTSLQNLDLSGNQISSVPEAIGKLTQLQELYLYENSISGLSEAIGKLTQLQELYLGDNSISSIPEAIGQLTSLQKLDLSDNSISRVPEEIGQLTSLQELDLGGNSISSIPEAIGQLTSLQYLNLRGNSISSIPEEIGQLTSLQELNLSFNSISSIPEAIGQLTSLQNIYLSNNSISRVSEAIGQLTQLQVLHLYRNSISSIPEAIGQLTSLQVLEFDGNPLNPQFAAAYSQGDEVLLQYLRSIAQDPVKSNEAKLILVGEGEVGKTSLLAALRGDPWVENRDTTHGVEIKPVTVKHPDSKENLLLNGWDFGGQPVYRPTHQLFFSAPAVYLVVWKPREGLEAAFVEYWIDLIKRRAPEAKILIVATHGGPNRRQPDIDSYDITHRFGRHTIGGFFHVDSNTEVEENIRGIHELKRAIASVAADLPGVGDKVPAKWQELRQTLLAREEAYLSYDQVVALCADRGMDEKETDLFLLLSHTLGHIIHYHDDNILKDTVILKPDWLTKAISFVLDDKTTRDRNGLVTFSHLNHLWNDPQREETERYREDLHPKFLKLMERFEISYRVVEPDNPHSNTSLIAQLVSDTRPEPLPEWESAPEAGDNEQQRICRIVDDNGNAAHAEGLFYRLIVRLHKYSLGREDHSQSTHWKRGLILDADYNGRALLEYKGTDLWITVRAAFPEYFIGLLTEEVKWLVKDFWKGLNCKVMVPCIQPCGKNLPGTKLFEVKDLIERKKRGQTEDRCDVSGCDEWQNIDNLLRNAPPPATSTVTIDQTEALASQQISQLDADGRALLSQVDLQYSELQETAIAAGKDGPRLFSFQPMDPGFFDRPKWMSAKFQLTLWCEHSRKPLPALNPEDPKLGVYEIELPREWLVKSKSYLELMTNTLSAALPLAGPLGPLAGPLVKWVMDKMVYSAAKKELILGKKTIEAIAPESEEISERSRGERYGKAKPFEGEILPKIHAILREQDSEKDTSFGGLIRVRNKRREFLWVHPRFQDDDDYS